MPRKRPENESKRGESFKEAVSATITKLKALLEKRRMGEPLPKRRRGEPEPEDEGYLDYIMRRDFSHLFPLETQAATRAQPLLLPQPAAAAPTGRAHNAANLQSRLHALANAASITIHNDDDDDDDDDDGDDDNDDDDDDDRRTIVASKVTTGKPSSAASVTTQKRRLSAPHTDPTMSEKPRDLKRLNTGAEMAPHMRPVPASDAGMASYMRPLPGMMVQRVRSMPVSDTEMAPRMRPAFVSGTGMTLNAPLTLSTAALYPRPTMDKRPHDLKRPNTSAGMPPPFYTLPARTTKESTVENIFGMERAVGARPPPIAAAAAAAVVVPTPRLLQQVHHHPLPLPGSTAELSLAAHIANASGNVELLRDLFVLPTASKSMSSPSAFRTQVTLHPKTPLNMVLLEKATPISTIVDFVDHVCTLGMALIENKMTALLTADTISHMSLINSKTRAFRYTIVFATAPTRTDTPAQEQAVKVRLGELLAYIADTFLNAKRIQVPPVGFVLKTNMREYPHYSYFQFLQILSAELRKPSAWNASHKQMFENVHNFQATIPAIDLPPLYIAPTYIPPAEFAEFCIETKSRVKK